QAFGPEIRQVGKKLEACQPSPRAGRGLGSPRWSIALAPSSASRHATAREEPRPAAEARSIVWCEGGDKYGLCLRGCQDQIHHILWPNFRAGARYWLLTGTTQVEVSQEPAG